ncbi:MAG: ROK family protein [Bacteroidota bacterium]
MEKVSVGIDIGGSHITCQLFDLNSNKLVEGTKIRITVDGNGLKESILGSWGKAIQRTISQTDKNKLAGIGFAMPGPFDYKNGVAWFDKKVGKFHSLHGVNVKTELQKRLDLSIGFPFRFLNDAVAFAVGESNTESVSMFRRVLVLTLGTGFGSTFIENGLPVAGKYGIPDDGFLYHVPFKTGIADEYFSTRWFRNEYKIKTGEEILGVKELADIAEKNDKVLSLFHEFGKNLVDFLIPWIQAFNAECIVLGGNISKSLALFENKMAENLINNNLKVNICRSTLDEGAALTGSARLCDDEFYNNITF